MNVAELDEETRTDRASEGRRHTVGLLGAAAVLALTCVLSLAIGTENVGLSTVWHAIVDYTDTGDQWIVYELRIPRTLLGIVVGIALLAPMGGEAIGLTAIHHERHRFGSLAEGDREAA